MDETSDFLREKEAAGVGKLKGNTFRKYRQLGVGPPYIKISARCVRYRLEDVLRWLESRRVEPGADGESQPPKPAKRTAVGGPRDGR